MELLLDLAKNGFFATLFVISALVNIYQYKLNNNLRDNHLADWKGALGLANTLAQANQKVQEAAIIMQQGVEIKLQRIMDKLKLA